MYNLTNTEIKEMQRGLPIVNLVNDLCPIVELKFISAMMLSCTTKQKEVYYKAKSHPYSVEKIDFICADLFFLWEKLNKFMENTEVFETMEFIGFLEKKYKHFLENGDERVKWIISIFMLFPIPSVGMGDFAIKNFKTESYERQKIELLQKQASQESIDDDKLDEIVIKLIQLKQNKEATSKENDDCTALLDAYYENKEDKEERILTPFTAFNEATKNKKHANGGYGLGQMWLLIARRGTGKTTLALQMLIDLAKQGIPSHFYSLEMRQNDVIESLLRLCKELNIEHTSIFDYKKFRILGQKYNTPEQIMLKVKQNPKPKVIFIDYIQRLKKNPREDTLSAYERFSVELANLAIEENICVIGLSQPPKDRDAKILTAKGSGAWEDNASFVFTLDNDDIQTHNNLANYKIACTKSRFSAKPNFPLTVEFDVDNGFFTEMKNKTLTY